MELGATLHSALKDTGYFPKYMINMIQLGEETGRLEEVLNSLSKYYDREDEIASGIKSAVAYPLVLSAVMIAVIVVMIAKVLPVFSQIYAELGSELTGTAAVLMKLSEYINRYLLIIIAVMLFAALVLFIFFKTRFGKKFLMKTALSMSIASSRFANCMALALSSGLDTDQGLMLAEQLVDNPYMASRIKKCRDLTASGRGFAEAVLTSGIFSKIYTSMITIGFRTGSMDEVMHQISEEYEEETDKQIAKFISVLEPTLVIILSIFIGLILISFLLPLIGIMSSIG
jgi:type IV pilus assembly protein PilC